MNDKESERKKFKETRDAIAPAARKSAARKISAQLLNILEFIGAKTVAIYITKGSEVETVGLIRKLAKRNVRVVAPKIVDNAIRYYPIKTLADCAPGNFGVLEPKSDKELDPRQLDVILVPGIVFDRNGYRLGYGKGFYDKLLSAQKLFNTIGLTYDSQLVANLPHDANDVPVNWILTETQTLCLAHEEI